MPREVYIVAAIDEDGAIGQHDTNRIPWRLQEDLKHFRDLTLHRIVVMGRRTHESIGRRLNRRVNLVLTRDPLYQPADGCHIVHTIEEVLAAVPSDVALCVIGGSAVYAAFLPFATRLYLTRVGIHSKGDVYFPAVDWSRWRCAWREAKRDEEQAIAFTYEFYLRSTATSITDAQARCESQTDGNPSN